MNIYHLREYQKGHQDIQREKKLFHYLNQEIRQPKTKQQPSRRHQRSKNPLHKLKPLRSRPLITKIPMQTLLKPNSLINHRSRHLILQKLKKPTGKKINKIILHPHPHIMITIKTLIIMIIMIIVMHI